jgi:hypothetical protein
VGQSRIDRSSWTRPRTGAGRRIWNFTGLMMAQPRELDSHAITVVVMDMLLTRMLCGDALEQEAPLGRGGGLLAAGPGGQRGPGPVSAGDALTDPTAAHGGHSS